MAQDYVSLWDIAGEDTERAQRTAALAYATSALSGVQEFLYAATSDADLGNRLALAADRVATAAKESGVSAEELSERLRTEASLVVQAKKSSSQKTASGSNTSRNCTNGNHSSCTGSSCRCGCHSPMKQRSGACADGDHNDCQMNDGDCLCRCHGASKKSSSRRKMTYTQSMKIIRQALQEGDNYLSEVASEDEAAANEPSDARPSYSGVEAFESGDYVHPTNSRQSAKTKGLYGMGDGDTTTHTVGGVPFDVKYHSEQAMADNGSPARGYHRGVYTVTSPDGSYKFFHHGPCGPKLDRAQAYAADEAMEHMNQHALRHSPDKKRSSKTASDDCKANHTYHESYGEVTRPQLAAYRKHNISTSDHDSLVDAFGEHDHAGIVKEVKRQVAQHGGFSFLDLPQSGYYASLKVGSREWFDAQYRGQSDPKA